MERSRQITGHGFAARFRSPKHTPARIYSGRIVDIDPERWTCKVFCKAANITADNVMIPSLYTHPFMGEGVHIMPEVGAHCMVAVSSDEQVFLLCSRSLVGMGNIPDGPAGEFVANRPYLNPGDITLDTRDGNGLHIRRGGVVDLLSTSLCRVLLEPQTNKLTLLAENLKSLTLAGQSEWRTIRPEEDDAGRVGTKYEIKAKEYADHKGYITRLQLGNTDGDPIELQEGDGAEIEDFVQVEETYTLNSVATNLEDVEIKVMNYYVESAKPSARVVDFRVFEDDNVEESSATESFEVGIDKEGDLLLTSSGFLDLTAIHMGLHVPGGVPTSSTSKVVVTKTEAGTTEPVMLGETFITDLNASLTEISSAIQSIGIPLPTTVEFLANMAASLTAGTPYLSQTLESE